MADPDETNLNSSPNPEEENDEEEEEEEVELDEPTSSDSDSDSESETGLLPYTRAGGEPDTDDEENNTPEANVKRFMRVLNSKRRKRELEEEAEEYTYHEDLFDFPYDPENWREEDLKELWGDAPIEMTKPGWDPNWVDEEEEDIISEETRAGRDPPIAPFYVPYRKPFPVVPDNNYDISNPKSVIEELDRIEEFLKWVSYIFADGSSWVSFLLTFFFWRDLA